MTQAPAKTKTRPQPAWPAALAVLAVGGLYLALPEPLTFGPSWLLLVVVLVLLIPLIIARVRGSFELNQRLGYVLLAVVTAAMFPQMTLAPSTQKPIDPAWSPGFVDYLFLAFNTSTAFSPTDSPVLSRWAKVLMMIQSSISLATLALLAARAVNIL
jgi:hypothetical protein